MRTQNPRRHFIATVGALVAAAATGRAFAATEPDASAADAEPVVSGSLLPYLERDDVQAFLGEMASRHGFAPRELEDIFAQVQFQAGVMKSVTRPHPTDKSWRTYRSVFLNNERLSGGEVFRRENAEALARAASTYGVPEEIIVAIIGVETKYGRITGGYRVIDSLTTLAFDYPRRGRFFRGELEQFLLFVRELGDDALAMKGSFAGAMGLPQFMPSSYRRYAVDFDSDGRRDLFTPADAIGSVGNFLKEHGWVSGGPIAVPVQTEGEAWRTLVDGGIKPVRPLSTLAAAGVRWDSAAGATQLPPDTDAVLIELETPDAPSAYWVGFRNFYALTRYNQSSFYAIAVVELANALRNGGKTAGAALPRWI